MTPLKADDGSRPNPVTVQILDKEYRIACNDNEQHGLMDCARLLDRRMREVRQNGRVIGADRIAVMAALNLLYELMQQRGEAPEHDEERLTVEHDEERLTALAARLNGALADARATLDLAPASAEPNGATH